MQVKKNNEEVLYSDEKITQVTAEDIAYLKEQALKNERKRIRLCAHRDVHDSLHEMLIVHAQDTYVRPHRHLNKSESFHVIEGVVDVVIYEENGSIKEVISLGDYASGRCFFYRINDPFYHTLLIRSDFVVFHETTNGPFNREETEFAPWSPQETHTDAVRKFMEQLSQAVASIDPGLTRRS